MLHRKPAHQLLCNLNLQFIFISGMPLHEKAALASAVLPSQRQMPSQMPSRLEEQFVAV